MQETQVQSLGGKIPWRREWLPTPVFLPGEFHGQRSLVGYSLWGREESDTIDQLARSLFSLKKISLKKKRNFIGSQLYKPFFKKNTHPDQNDREG